MSKILWKSLLITPALVGTALVFGNKALATPAQTNSQSATAPETQIAQAVPAANGNTLDQIVRYGNEGSANRSISQVTSVSQLTDVDPTHWAFQALQSLVERYGCIEGYPDRTYRGNRALTRYEFAAGLNACLDRINELIAAATADLPSKEDLATIQRLQEEFAAELATLRGRVDALEARTARLEAQQFSTTTKLKGEVIFALTDAFGGANINGNDDDNGLVFQDRVRLEFQTSFSGRDLLHTRLAAGNARPFTLPNVNRGRDGAALTEAGGDAISTFEGNQQFNLGNSPNFDNDIILDWLAYEFPIFGKSRGYVAATGGIHSDYTPTINPYFEDFDGGNGALSAFAQESPIYRIGGGAGGAVNLAFGGGGILRPSSLTLGYLAGPGANLPFERNGLTDGDYAALAQLNLNLGDKFGVALTYVHGYHNTGSAIFDLGGSGRNSFSGGVVGTALANFPAQVATVPLNRPVVTNSYGIATALRVSKNFSISGYAALTDATIIGRGGGTIWTYGGGLAFPNFGREGSLLGLFAGVQPYLTDLDVPGGANFEDDPPYHVEGFYKIQITDNISLTPGVIWLLSPNQDNDNDDVFIGTLRTTFSF
jgi:Carbohydrate-selective porin, OprB family/S-layer homology domain